MEGTTSVRQHVPRSQWRSHPQFPQQTLLLGSHENFIRINTYLVRESKELSEPGSLEGLYRRWISAMRSHEAYEEHKLYPYLSKRWDVSFADAEEGHHALHEKHASVLSAFSLLRSSQSSDYAKKSLTTALQEHLDTLKEHLRVEEDLVIPLLLSLSPKEFKIYCDTPIQALLNDLT